MRKIIIVFLLMVISLSVFYGCESENDLENEHEHEWGEWEVVQEPTCLVPGLQERSCDCGKVKNKELAVLEHDYLNGKCTACETFDETYCQKLYNELRAEMLALDKNDNVLNSIKEKLDNLPEEYNDVKTIKEEYLFVSAQEQILGDAIVNYACKYFEPDNDQYYIDYAKVRRAYLNLVNNDNEYNKWDLIGLANDTIMGKSDDGYNRDFVFFVMVGEWSTKDGNYYFDVIEKDDNSLYFRCNIPNEKDSSKEYYYSIDGKNIGYEEIDNDSNSFNSYRIEEIDEEYIKVFCYKNSKTYTLYLN